MIHIIPQPKSLTANVGLFALTQDTTVVVSDDALAPLRDLLIEYVSERCGITLSAGQTPGASSIVLEAQDCSASAQIEDADESYQLKATTQGIHLRGASLSGVARGIQTARQLLTLQDGQWHVACCDIEDTPEFKWRGMHLDVSRHFFSVDEVCRFIDAIALHRMNVCHLHLTDDQGWRIEIKAFPKLTEIASTRACSLEGHESARPRRYDSTPHSGFFSQEDIKLIVNFAAKRHVTLVPEIDMPGHMQAAIAAYPEWGCTTESVEPRCHWGISQHILNPEMETVNAMKTILDEVMSLFPGRYVHIGGDEAVKNHWQESQRAQALMAERGLKDEHELQSWYIKQLDDHISQAGRKLIGWDEILEGGLADNATVMSWRNMDHGIEAAKQGNDVVMAPNQWVYFDHCQAEPACNEPLNIGGMTTVGHVYAFSPIPDDLSEEHRKHVLGGQGQVWTEYIPTMEHAMIMTFPRACALAEVLWTHPEKSAYPDFLNRLAEHRNLLKDLGISAHSAP